MKRLMPPRRSGAMLCTALASSGCPAAHTTPAPAAPILGEVHGDPQFTARLRIYDKRGTEVTLPAMLDAARQSDVVFVGETHNDAMTHRLEAAIFEGVAARRNGKVALSMEMFARDVQPVLDRFVAGTIDEAAMLADANPWANYRTGYRALVLAAKDAGAPIVAANTPRSVMREVGGQGAEAYAKAKQAHPKWLPADMFAPSEAYQARVARATRGHGAVMGQSDPQWSVQNYWDNTMADAIANARGQWPDRAVVHVAGGFHVARHDGTVAQLVRRRPDDTVTTIAIVPTWDLATAKPDPALADFVAYVRADAQGPQSGVLAVTVPTRLQWRVSLPDDAAPDARHPLLVVLADNDTRAVDAMLRWRARLSDQAVIAVVVPPYRQSTALGWTARRWYMPGSFAEDVQPVLAGLPRLIAYATDHLPVDAERVTLVGERAGGAVALWAALYGDDLPVRAIAIDPETPAAMARASLPETPTAVPALDVVVPGAASDALQAALALYPEVGLHARVRPLPEDRAVHARAAAGLVAEAVGVPPVTVSGDPRVLVVGGLAAHGRDWAQTLAAAWERRGAPTTLADAATAPGAVVLGGSSPDSSVWVAEALREGGLPKPRAAFGGGTVLVVPKGMPARVLDAWTKTLEAAAATRGRFSPLKLAREGTGELREAVLAVTQHGLSTVLVTPAVFAAHPPLMRRLQQELEDLPAETTVQWLPGLGAAVAEHAAPPGHDASATPPATPPAGGPN